MHGRPQGHSGDPNKDPCKGQRKSFLTKKSEVEVGTVRLDCLCPPLPPERPTGMPLLQEGLLWCWGAVLRGRSVPRVLGAASGGP